MLHNKKGTIIPLVAIMLTVILGIGALVIDLSQAYANQTRIKNAVDLAGLAGISQLNGPSSIASAKNAALTYLNDNLTMTIPSFSGLTLGSSGLMIQAGIYDFVSMNFTFDEVSSNVNALMISYSYDSMNILAPILMAGDTQLVGTSVVAKQVAAKAQPGSAFPLVIYTSAINGASMNGNMVTIYSSTAMDNSYWTDYTDANASTTEISNIIDYFVTGMGTSPSGVSVNDTFAVNDGGMGGVFMSMDPDFFVGMTFLFSVVTPTMDNEVQADGFIGATINSITDNMGAKTLELTITPGYIDNSFGGLQIGTGMTNVDSSDQPLLANSYGLVQ